MKKILVCIDGSLYGQTCTQYALWFARKNGASVDALYVSDLWRYEAPLMVADFGGTLGTQPYMGLSTQLRHLENEKAATLKAYVRAAFEKEGLAERLNFHHLSGSLVDCLGEFEGGAAHNAMPADMLVIGKRGEAANMAKAHLGSNMERVIRSTSLPCFVANREFFEPRKILFAFDGSPSANKSLAWFGANQALFANAEVHVISVAARPADAAQTATNLTIAEKALEGFGCKTICKALEGIPADVIASHQQESGANLLLMGAYGHSRIRRLLIGSTTVELLQRCKVPIILFR
ncbi:MAG: universal stress protein [Puniceicoccales bacterium]|nr:universal stress protein [Puniceicoccales bacterium]